MKADILVGLGFSQIIAEAQGNTPTGSSLINKYKSILMANESSFSLVNQFINEAAQCRYDAGVVKVLENVSEYIQDNKISWALASACESIERNGQSHNYLNRQACRQVEKLLEMKENDVKSYIKAGALRNVMYCEAFRNIAKQVFRESPIVEANAQYTKVNPVSIVENVGDGLCFQVRGSLYKMDNAGHVQEASWNEVSNDFKTITRLMENKMTTTNGDEICVEWAGNKYKVSKRDEVIRESKNGTSQTFTTAEFRENNRIALMSTNPRYRSQMAEVLESIALLSDLYEQVAVMDNASIYRTDRDEFLVIESGSDLYATLLGSNHQSKWTVNENAIDTLSFIKSKTNVQLEGYEKNVTEALEKADEESRKVIEERLRNDEISSLKERVAVLTEAFKNDPTKLAILAQTAQKITELESADNE